MFWRLGFGHPSPIETILDSEDFTLQQLLDEDDLIQECKQLNKKLIDFLAMPEQVEALINYVVTEVPPDSDDKAKFIYPYKSSEVLSADLTAVIDCIFQSEALLDKLFDFVRKDPPLNPLLAGYFVKVVTTLLSRRPEQTLQVLQKKAVVPLLLNHLGASSILDLLLKIVSEAEESMEPNAAEWLYQIDLVGQLINKLDPELDPEIHANASTALVGFVAPPVGDNFDTLRFAAVEDIWSHFQAPPPMSWQTTPQVHRSRFAGQLLAKESVAPLLERSLKGSPSTLQHGLTVLVEIVRHCVTSNRQAAEIQPLLSLVRTQLKDFVDILRSPPQMAPIHNTSGTLDPPLGSNRLKIVEVIHELLTLKDEAVEKEVIRLKVLPLCLDLFFSYEWHSFLHNLVKNTLHMIIEGQSEALKRSLFTDGELLERIVDAHRRNDEALKQPKSCRKGYMGQLRLVSNLIMKQKATDTWFEEFTGRQQWKDFVAQHLERLNDVNERRQLGGQKPHSNQSHSDDENAFNTDSNAPFEFRTLDNSGELFSNDHDDEDVDLESGSRTVAIEIGDFGGKSEDKHTTETQIDDLSKSMNELKVDTADADVQGYSQATISEAGADSGVVSSPTKDIVGPTAVESTLLKRVILTITLSEGPGPKASVVLTPI